MSKSNVDDSNKYEDGLTYKSDGVDIDVGSELVKRIAKMAPRIGGFGGLGFLSCGWKPGTYGVGTKLKLAFETGIHDTIGIDLQDASLSDMNGGPIMAERTYANPDMSKSSTTFDQTPLCSKLRR